MGLFRKVASVYTLGAVDFKSDKERAPKNIKRTAAEAKRQTAEAVKQTALLQQLAEAEARPPARAKPTRAPAKKSQALAQPTPSAATPTPLLIAAELRELAELRDRGVLTDEEFEAQKKRLLNNG